MKKRRMPRPNQNYWFDENNYLHICHFLSCDDGCNCESARATRESILEIINKSYYFFPIETETETETETEKGKL